MKPSRNFIRGVVLLLAWLSFGPGALGRTHAQLGTIVQDAEMPTIAGGNGSPADGCAGERVYLLQARPGVFADGAQGAGRGAERTQPANRCAG